MAIEYFLREADSDVVAVRLLGQYPSPIEVQLDASLPASDPLAERFAFITPPPLPGRELWAAGQYTLTLEVAQGDSISYTAELWRVDADGAESAQIGTRPATQTGDGAKTFVFTGAEIVAAKTDRLKLKVFAQNDTAAAVTFSLRCSASKLGVPFTEVRTFRARNDAPKFIGVIPRPGEPKPDADGFVEV